MKFLLLAILQVAQSFLDYGATHFTPEFQETLSAIAAPAAYNTVTVQIPMRDGVKLNTILLIPINASPDSTVGAVILRTPYEAAACLSAVIPYTSLGWVGVAQDCRGRWASEGEWTMWTTAAEDGVDTFEYLAAQPWSNGLFATTGFSAPGVDSYVQAMAPGGPYPGLKSQLNFVSSALFHGATYQQGAYRQSLVSGWLQYINETTYIPTVLEHEGWSDWWNTTTMSGLSPVPVPDTTPWSAISYPIIHGGGFYDIFSNFQYKTWTAIQQYGSNPGPSPQILVMGPGGHCNGANGGQIPWPNASWGFDQASYYSVSLFTSTIGSPVPSTLQVHAAAREEVMARVSAAERLVQVAPIIVYVIGPNPPVMGPGGAYSAGNLWFGFNATPAVDSTALYLGPGGELSLTPLPTAGSVSYLSDPAVPIPTTGGSNLNIPCGPMDHAQIEQQFAPKYMALWTTQPMEQDVVILGLITAHLTVSFDSVDADVAVAVKDVYPAPASSDYAHASNDGARAAQDAAPPSMLIQDGIVRMRWQDGAYASTPTLIVPGALYNVTIEVGIMGYVLNSGHSLRIAVQGSNYPRFSVNQNNGDGMAPSNSSAPVVSTASVHYGPGSVSSLVLPILPLGLEALQRHVL
jgi:hypothetical protein